MDKLEVLEKVAYIILEGNVDCAEKILQREYPFKKMIHLLDVTQRNKRWNSLDEMDLLIDIVVKNL